MGRSCQIRRRQPVVEVCLVVQAGLVGCGLARIVAGTSSGQRDLFAFWIRHGHGPAAADGFEDEGRPPSGVGRCRGVPGCTEGGCESGCQACGGSGVRASTAISPPTSPPPSASSASAAARSSTTPATCANWASSPGPNTVRSAMSCGPATASRAGYCHQDVPALCERLRLPAPPSSHTKHQRLSASLQECSDDRLEHVTEAILDSEPFPAWERTQLQGVLWSGCPGPWLGATVRTGGAALGWSAGPVTVPGACASPVAHSWSTRERSVTFG